LGALEVQDRQLGREDVGVLLAVPAGALGRDRERLLKRAREEAVELLERAIRRAPGACA
jgi:hypothetical protein